MGDFPSSTTGLPSGSLSAVAQNGGVGDWMTYGNAGLAISATWPAANLALYYPVYLEIPILIYQMGWENGATANGNIDAGVYTVTGTKVVSTGTIAQAGTSTMQFADITDTWLTPGTYFLAIQCSATTLTFVTNSQPAWRWRTSGCQEEVVGSFGLPATATFAAHGRAYGLAVHAMVKATA